MYNYIKKCFRKLIAMILCNIRLQPLATQWHCGAKWGEHVWVFVMRSMGKSTLNARMYREAGALAP